MMTSCLQVRTKNRKLVTMHIYTVKQDLKIIDHIGLSYIVYYAQYLQQILN